MDTGSTIEGYAPVKNSQIYFRQIGHNRPIIVIHGGPSFDHTYLLPDMDRLSGSYRLLYYDQRGRGKSEADVQNITVETEIEDIESLRDYLQLDSAVLLGHSWGGYLAMEYAIRYPQRVSHLILMNTSVASHDDYLLFEQELRRRTAVLENQMEDISSSRQYLEAEPEVVAQYYRLYFSTTFKQPENFDRLNLNFPREGILKGRQASQHLLNETWHSTSFNIIPQLKSLRIPTLMLHGDYDFIPVAAVTSIAQAMPRARFVLLEDCGHFSYIERPNAVQEAVANFLVGN